MKKLLWIVLSVVLTLIALTALTYDKKEERTYGDVVERLYNGTGKVTKFLILSIIKFQIQIRNIMLK